MAKETQTPSQAAKNHFTAPMFAVARAVLSEIEQQGDRWLEYGVSQAGEGAKLMHAMRAHALSATRTAIELAEKWTDAAIDGASTWSRPFEVAQS